MTARELIAALEALPEDKKDFRVFTENLDYDDNQAEIVAVGLSSHYDHPNRYDVVFLIQ